MWLQHRLWLSRRYIRLLHSLCVFHTDTQGCNTACVFITQIYKPPTQVYRLPTQLRFLWHRYMKLEHRKTQGKCTKIMEYGMNQGLVCPFGLKLCQDVAMVSPNPLECLRTPKTFQKLLKKSPLLAPISPQGLWGAPPVQFTLLVVPQPASEELNSLYVEHSSHPWLAGSVVRYLKR